MNNVFNDELLLFDNPTLITKIEAMGVSVNSWITERDNRQPLFGRTLLHLTFNGNTIVGYIIYTCLPSASEPTEFKDIVKIGVERFCITLGAFTMEHANDHTGENYAMEVYV